LAGCGRGGAMVYRLCGVNPAREQSGRRYAGPCLWFSGLSMLLLYAMFRLQNHLPINPVDLGAVDQGELRPAEGTRLPAHGLTRTPTSRTSPTSPTL